MWKTAAAAAAAAAPAAAAPCYSPAAAAAARACVVRAALEQQPAAAVAARFSTSAVQQQQQYGNMPPGQAFLATLVDFEKLGVPKAAGVAAAPAPGAAAGVAQVQASTSSSSSSSSSPKGFDLGTMRRLLAAMGDPQQQLSVVHIAGTKGKGSVAALISGVLRAAGYRVGTYTSPHMFDIRERIVVGGAGAPHLKPLLQSDTASAAASAAGGGGGGHGSSDKPAAAAAAAGVVPAAVPVSAQQFEALALRAAAAVSEMSASEPQPQHNKQDTATTTGTDNSSSSSGGSSSSSSGSSSSSSGSSSRRPSHFEVVTAMALQHFVDEGVDVAVVEAGLGGATDATNVFGPQQLQLSVLTAVGMDHVEALGGSLASIAAAKAGIMKPGVPVIVGPQAGGGSSGDSSGSSGGSGGSGSGSSGGSDGDVVCRVFREAAGAADMHCPLLMAAEAVQVQPAAAAAAAAAGSSSSNSSSIVILPGPGEHLARQLLSVAANGASIAAAAAQGGGASASDSSSSSSSSSGSVPDLALPSVQLQLVGQHQAGNVATAFAAAATLSAQGWSGVTADAIHRGLEAAWLPGRFQVAQLPDSPTRFVLDGAHTADSAAALTTTLRAAFPEDPVVLLVAMAGDKQHRDVLQALRVIRPRVAVFTSVPIAGSHARSAPPGTLAAHWQAAAMLSAGRPFRCREMIQAGLGAALDKARHELGAYGGKGVVVVTGSLHAVAAGLKHLQLA